MYDAHLNGNKHKKAQKVTVYFFRSSCIFLTWLFLFLFSFRFVFWFPPSLFFFFFFFAQHLIGIWKEFGCLEGSSSSWIEGAVELALFSFCCCALHFPPCYNDLLFCFLFFCCFIFLNGLPFVFLGFGFFLLDSQAVRRFERPNLCYHPICGGEAVALHHWNYGVWCLLSCLLLFFLVH